MKHVYDFPMVAITVDIVIFRINSRGAIEVLTIIRDCEPNKCIRSLIGGRETNIDLSSKYSKFVGYYDEPNRDTRGRVVSFCYTITIGPDVKYIASDAESFEWTDFEDIRNNVVRLDLDHNQMVRDARVVSLN